MRKFRTGLLVGCLSLWVVVPAAAQQVDSLDFLNAAPGIGNVTCDVNAQGRNPVRAGVPLVGGETQAQQALAAFRNLCTAAADCVDAGTKVPAACGALVFGILDCPDPDVGNGFRLTYTGGDKVFAQRNSTPPNSLANVGIATTIGGHIVGVDIAQHVFMRVNPNGNTGNVTFRFFHNVGGANPRTATVTPTGTDEDIHKNLASSIESATSGANDLELKVIVRCPPLKVARGRAPEFLEGCQVQVIDPKGNLTEVTMEGQTGQRNNLETGTPGGQIPALNAIGWAISLSLLLLAGIWFLYRRQAPEQA